MIALTRAVPSSIVNCELTHLAREPIDFARAEKIGPHGTTAAALADALKRTEPALAWLRARHADGALPLLRLPAKHDDYVPIKDAARRLTATSESNDIAVTAPPRRSAPGGPGQHCPRRGQHGTIWQPCVSWPGRQPFRTAR